MAREGEEMSNRVYRYLQSIGGAGILALAMAATACVAPSSDPGATESASPSSVSGAVEKADDEGTDGGIVEADDIESEVQIEAEDEEADHERTDGGIDEADDDIESLDLLADAASDEKEASAVEDQLSADRKHKHHKHHKHHKRQERDFKTDLATTMTAIDGAYHAMKAELGGVTVRQQCAMALAAIRDILGQETDILDRYAIRILEMKHNLEKIKVQLLAAITLSMRLGQPSYYLEITKIQSAWHAIVKYLWWAGDNIPKNPQ
jgi:hypothetical protein